MAQLLPIEISLTFTHLVVDNSVRFRIAEAAILKAGDTHDEKIYLEAPECDMY